MNSTSVATVKLLLTAICTCMLLLSQETSATLVDSKIKARISGFKGRVNLYAKNLETGATYTLEGDDPVRTASTIKFPIMIECFAEAQEGKLDLDSPVKLNEDEKVSGSGILQDLSAGRDYPLRDLIVLMITLSDNTATNRGKRAHGKAGPGANALHAQDSRRWKSPEAGSQRHERRGS
jgi:beta-lactamase class A